MATYKSIKIAARGDHPTEFVKASGSDPTATGVVFLAYDISKFDTAKNGPHDIYIAFKQALDAWLKNQPPFGYVVA